MADGAHLALPRPVKRSVTIAGHPTSLTLEAAFWDALKEMAQAQAITVSQALAAIDRGRGEAGLSSAVRVAILAYYRGAPTRSGPAQRSDA